MKRSRQAVIAQMVLIHMIITQNPVCRPKMQQNQPDSTLVEGKRKFFFYKPAIYVFTTQKA